MIGSGVEYDLSDRLGTRSNKPLVVIPLAQSETYHVLSAEVAGNALGATHALRLDWAQSADAYRVSADLLQTIDNRRVGGFTKTFQRTGLGAIPDEVSRSLASALGRDVYVGGETVGLAAYGDYAEGLHFLREAKDSSRAVDALQRAAASSSNRLVDLRLAEASLPVDARGRTGSAAERVRRTLMASTAELDASTALLMARLRASLDPALAIDSYREALTSHSRSGELWRRLADALSAADRLDEAEDAYGRAIAAAPGYFQPLLNYGIFSYARGDYERASRQFRKAAELAPGLAIARQYLASALLLMGDFEGSEQEYRQSLNILRDPNTLLGIGAVLSYEGKQADAVAYYEQARDLGPEDSHTLANLADAYRRTRNPGAAEAYEHTIAAADRALTANPAKAQDRAFKAYGLARLGRRAEALREVDRALSDGTSDILVRRMAVMVFETLGMRERSLQQFRAAPRLVGEMLRQPDLAELQRDPRFIDLTRSASNNQSRGPRAAK